MRLGFILALTILNPSVASSQDQDSIEIAQLCVATSEHAKQLAGVALGFGKGAEMASYMWEKVDAKMSQKADALSIVGGTLTKAILLHPSLGLPYIRSLALTCSFGEVCETSQLFLTAIVFSEKIMEFCREDASKGVN